MKNKTLDPKLDDASVCTGPQVTAIPISLSASNHLPAGKSPILIVAINARYSHCSYAARTLKINLRELKPQCTIMETELIVTPFQLASQIVECNPRIVVFSTYLWNIRLIEATARILSAVAPQIKRIAGGPELTPDYSNATLFHQCIIGEGESGLRESCQAWLDNPGATLPRIVVREPENIIELRLPYSLYTNEDIAHRVIYVEASRGCPYACSYCTSAETGLRLIPLRQLLPGLQSLWERGVRQFKFLDRSFTASLAHSNAVMHFFLERVDPQMCLHFEINTEHLHNETTELMSRFPANTLHLECGIQTLNPDVAVRIGRSGKIEQTLQNLKSLTSLRSAVVHADLIFGLPGENEASFAAGFNRLMATCAPPEVQINLLKGLPGTALVRHAARYGLKFNPEPPYELLESNAMNFQTLVKLQRFARCWELVHNRGRYVAEVEELQQHGSDLYQSWTQLADFICAQEGRMFKISGLRMKQCLEEFLAK
ncbi:MAG: DUF4080 domain-containing protein [Kiritimatiellae bacterium]|nr:DUF4080 domain-containing protein [Kiritimatiellia bacterium]